MPFSVFFNNLREPTRAHTRFLSLLTLAIFLGRVAICTTKRLSTRDRFRNHSLIVFHWWSLLFNALTIVAVEFAPAVRSLWTVDSHIREVVCRYIWLSIPNHKSSEGDDCASRCTIFVETLGDSFVICFYRSRLLLSVCPANIGNSRKFNKAFANQANPKDPLDRKNHCVSWTWFGRYRLNGTRRKPHKYILTFDCATSKVISLCAGGDDDVGPFAVDGTLFDSP